MKCSLKKKITSAGWDQLVGGEGHVQEVYTLTLTQEIENQSQSIKPWVPVRPESL